MRAEDPPDRQRREVREVLVVDRVELGLLDQVQQMGELHRQDAAGSQQHLQARHEIVQRRHVREHVVADDEVGRAALGDEFPGRLLAEEADHGRDSLRLRGGGHVRGRLHPEHRHAALDEPLQQVSVVRRDLDHARAAVEAEALDHLLDVAACVLDPRVREGREVDVVLEDVLGRGELPELHQQAAAAHAGVQRETRLLAREILLGDERVRERREPEIDERLRQGSRAEPAGRPGRAHQTFHGGRPEAHCSSSTILSRRLSMFCQ